MVPHRKRAPGDEYFNPLGNRPTYQGRVEVAPGHAARIREALGVLTEAGVPFIVAGAFAGHAYTGVWRDTKDLDLFLPPAVVPDALRALSGAGFETDVRHAWWLAKAWKGEYLIDLVFGIGNRELQVDDGWIERGLPAEILDTPVRLISVEDLVASKVFIAFRDRFDGADVAHLIRSTGGRIDWERVLDVLGERHRVLLLWHLVFFDYVYPAHADLLPADLMRRIFEERLAAWRGEAPPEEEFRGSLLDHRAFAIDLTDWGYPDPRTPADGVAEVRAE